MKLKKKNEDTLLGKHYGQYCRNWDFPMSFNFETLVKKRILPKFFL